MLAASAGLAGIEPSGWRRFPAYRLSREFLALNNLQLSASSQHAGRIVLAGLAQTVILDNFRHAHFPFHIIDLAVFSSAMNVPMSIPNKADFVTQLFTMP